MASRRGLEQPSNSTLMVLGPGHGPTQLYHLYVDRPVGSTNVIGLLPA